MWNQILDPIISIKIILYLKHTCEGISMIKALTGLRHHKKGIVIRFWKQQGVIEVSKRNDRYADSWRTKILPSCKKRKINWGELCSENFLSSKPHRNTLVTAYIRNESTPGPSESIYEGLVHATDKQAAIWSLHDNSVFLKHNLWQYTESWNNEGR